MKYLSRILNLDWLSRGGRSRGVETSSEDPRKEADDHDISVAKFDDDGSLYLISFDWTKEEINEWLYSGTFQDAWKDTMSESGFVITSGKLGGGDIEVVKSSLSEVFEHEEDE